MNLNELPSDLAETRNSLHQLAFFVGIEDFLLMLSLWGPCA